VVLLNRSEMSVVRKLLLSFVDSLALGLVVPTRGGGGSGGGCCLDDDDSTLLLLLLLLLWFFGVYLTVRRAT
jgi:hypothetical protein